MKSAVSLIQAYYENVVTNYSKCEKSLGVIIHLTIKQLLDTQNSFPIKLLIVHLHHRHRHPTINLSLRVSEMNFWKMNLLVASFKHFRELFSGLSKLTCCILALKSISWGIHLNVGRPNSVCQYPETDPFWIFIKENKQAS